MPVATRRDAASSALTAALCERAVSRLRKAFRTARLADRKALSRSNLAASRLAERLRDLARIDPVGISGEDSLIWADNSVLSDRVPSAIDSVALSEIATVGLTLAIRALNCCVDTSTVRRAMATSGLYWRAMSSASISVTGNMPASMSGSRLPASRPVAVRNESSALRRPVRASIKVVRARDSRASAWASWVWVAAPASSRTRAAFTCSSSLATLASFSATSRLAFSTDR